jgi:hypothetical protein
VPNIRTVLLLLFFVGKVYAADEFDGIKCGTAIPKFLLGKHSSNVPAATLEARHKDLGLKDLGGTEITNRLFLNSWQICGTEYEVLLNTKSGLIRDVLQFPNHSARAPMFIGTCQAGGKETSYEVLAVLNNDTSANARDPQSAKTLLKATSAWKVDPTKESFAPQTIDKLTCPLGGIVTQDGGP